MSKLSAGGSGPRSAAHSFASTRVTQPRIGLMAGRRILALPAACLLTLAVAGSPAAASLTWSVAASPDIRGGANDL